MKIGPFGRGDRSEAVSVAEVARAAERVTGDGRDGSADVPRLPPDWLLDTDAMTEGQYTKSEHWRLDGFLEHDRPARLRTVYFPLIHDTLQSLARPEFEDMSAEGGMKAVVRAVLTPLETIDRRRFREYVNSVGGATATELQKDSYWDELRLAAAAEIVESYKEACRKESGL